LLHLLAAGFGTQRKCRGIAVMSAPDGTADAARLRGPSFSSDRCCGRLWHGAIASSSVLFCL